MVIVEPNQEMGSNNLDQNMKETARRSKDDINLPEIGVNDAARIAGLRRASPLLSAAASQSLDPRPSRSIFSVVLPRFCCSGCSSFAGVNHWVRNAGRRWACGPVVDGA